MGGMTEAAKENRPWEGMWKSHTRERVKTAANEPKRIEWRDGGGFFELLPPAGHDPTCLKQDFCKRLPDVLFFRSALLDHFPETWEQVGAVVRTGARLGMVLDRE